MNTLEGKNRSHNTQQVRRRLGWGWESLLGSDIVDAPSNRAGDSVERALCIGNLGVWSQKLRHCARTARA